MAPHQPKSAIRGVPTGFVMTNNNRNIKTKPTHSICSKIIKISIKKFN